MSTATEVRKIIRKAKKRGWSATQNKHGGHYTLTWVDGRRVTASLSPANGRGIMNMVADLKRIERTTLQER